jgi:hypothetical protein
MRDGTYFIDLIAKYEQRAEVLRGLDPELIKRATAARDALSEFLEDIYEIDFDFRLSTARKMLDSSRRLEYFIDELDADGINVGVYALMSSASDIMQSNRQQICYNDLLMSSVDDLATARHNLDEFLNCEIKPHWHDLAAEERASQEPPKKRGRPRKAKSD